MTKEEAVKMLRTMQRTVYLGNRKFEDAIECAIKALSEPLQPWEVLAAQSVLSQPEPHWIPCSEGLPKEEGFYLVTLGYKHGAETNIRYFKIENGKRYWSLWGNENITAWMPKPEPYKDVTE